MLILLPVIFLLLNAAILTILHLARPAFRYFWLVASAGALAAVVCVALWQAWLPVRFDPLGWEPFAASLSSPAWLVDGRSWPYAAGLTIMALAIVVTSVVRENREPLHWSGIMVLTASGLLAVTAENALTLLLAWSALDLAELLIGLAATGGDKSESVVVGFTARLAGSGLVLWAGISSASSGAPLDLRAVPPQAGIYLLLAVGMRLGVLPLHLPYQEALLRRGFGTSLRLVSAASSLALLGRIPAGGMDSPLAPALFVLLALAGIYTSWMWLRASDELTGRPFWLIGAGSLAVAATLGGNPVGSIAWGISLVLAGTLLFTYSARKRTILWLPALAILGLTAWPFTLAASVWQGTPLLVWLAFLPVQALLVAGFIRHALHPGDSALESHPRWARALYPLGLGLPVLSILLLGVWGWDGAMQVGLWWAGLPGVPLAAAVAWLSLRARGRVRPIASLPTRWLDILRLSRLSGFLWGIYRSLGRLVNSILSLLEGDGGILWSLLLLVLLVSLLSQSG
ncbi:MAG: hypothetical protein FJZ96_14565 [Chloroflexi bacterium]|nr:hypothetical protein [Chloroflexota bacterium]